MMRFSFAKIGEKLSPQYLQRDLLLGRGKLPKDGEGARMKDYRKTLQPRCALFTQPKNGSNRKEELVAQMTDAIE